MVGRPALEEPIRVCYHFAASLQNDAPHFSKEPIVIKAAIIGDLFVRPAVLEQVLRKHLTPLAGELSVTLCELGYPIEPNRSDDELREFVGSPEDALAAVGDAQILVCHMPAMTRQVIEQLPGLRAIGCCRTEPVNINVAAATAAGIPVFYAPGRNARAVAEFTVGLIIAEYRDIARGHQALSQGIWRAELYLYDTAPHELYGQTVGLIGFGNIGRMMPGLLKPFGMRVLAYDPYVPDEAFAERGAERVYDMDALLAESDIVSLHARVTRRRAASSASASSAA